MASAIGQTVASVKSWFNQARRSDTASVYPPGTQLHRYSESGLRSESQGPIANDDSGIDTSVAEEESPSRARQSSDDSTSDAAQQRIPGEYETREAIRYQLAHGDVDETVDDHTQRDSGGQKRLGQSTWSWCNPCHG